MCISGGILKQLFLQVTLFYPVGMSYLLSHALNWFVQQHLFILQNNKQLSLWVSHWIIHWTDSFNNTGFFRKKEVTVFISKTVTICDMTSTLLPRWYRIHTNKKKWLVSAGFFSFSFWLNQILQFHFGDASDESYTLDMCYGADETRGVWIHLQGFYSGSWSKNKQGSCNGKQLQHRQDKGLIQETRARIKTRENRQSKTMITKWAT